MIQLNQDVLRQIFASALPGVIEAFASEEGQQWLTKAGINDSARRLATAFAHCHAETAGFSIKNLTENINYTAERMAAVWPNRFANAAAVKAKYGTATGWQKKAFDDIYGNRMGNRPGTSDGSDFIGSVGPQVTGRDGYREVGKRSDLPLEEQPALACEPENQPRVLAAFWMWKNLSPLADQGAVDAKVRPWNGGTNGLAERRKQFARILPLISAMPTVDAVKVTQPPAQPIPAPATPAPPESPQSAFSAFISALLSIFSKKG